MKESDRYKLTPVCWAESTGECSGDLTKEHVISKSILKFLSPLKAYRSDKKHINLGVGSYVLKRLCEGHNGNLSRYDSEALKLFRTLKDVHDDKVDRNFLKQNNYNYTIEVNRWNLERWYAKTYFSYLLFNLTAIRPTNLPFPLSAHSILGKLYNGESFDEPFGLYIVDPKKPLYKSNKSWLFKVESGASHIIKPNGVRSENYDYPRYFYTKLLGIEIVALFNVTAISDEQVIDGPLKPVIEMLNSRAVKDFIEFGIDAKHNVENVSYRVRMVMT